MNINTSENLNISVATVNGSGSQSANNILVRTIFRMNRSVSGKNIFPSNIQGLPTWFNIRINHKGYQSYQDQFDLAVNVNPKTLSKDIKKLKTGGLLVCGSDISEEDLKLCSNFQVVQIPFKELSRDLKAPVKIRKLLVNMIYVGVLEHILNLDKETLKTVVAKAFNNKDNVIEINEQAILTGYQYAQEHYPEVNMTLPEASERNEGKILIDGNSAAAAGLLAGGCTFMSWYPITPSSSIAENFMQYSYKFGKKEGKNTRAIVQAEDELSAISMVLGAGWAGSRAITCTSGPGVSLMAEAAGLSYFAEVPAVIWDVQRCGPSTGLPTRTQQGDITSAIFLSHGDTQHVVLIPGSPCECFEFGQTCFDLAERLQTLVVVLSDLDLGMNSWTCPSLKLENKPFDRGKVKTANDLQEGFGRFVDSDNDGIAPRTLPGTPSDYAAYFSRGTAHDDFAKYSEDADNYQRLMNRLQRKFETAKTLVPKPIIEKSSMNSGKVISIVTYGTSDSIKSELKELLAQKNIHINYMRLRAFPFSKEVENFINVDHEVFVVEQNLQGQMFKILRTECCFNQNLKSIAFSNGLPLDARKICEKILAALEINNELQ